MSADSSIIDSREEHKSRKSKKTKKTNKTKKMFQSNVDNNINNNDSLVSTSILSDNYVNPPAEYSGKDRDRLQILRHWTSGGSKPKSGSALAKAMENPAKLAYALGRPLQLNDIKDLNDSQLDQFYTKMLTNSSFQISTSEENTIPDMMKIAASRPKELKKFGFSTKKNVSLVDLSTEIKVGENEKFRLFRNSGALTYYRLSKLLICYTPGITAASKYDGKVTFQLIDSRMMEKDKVIRESSGNLLFSSITFMDADHFLPKAEFDKLLLLISVPGTGLTKGHTWGSVWVHIEVETTDCPTQKPISAVRLVPTIPVTSLMTRGNFSPTKYDGHMREQDMSVLAKSAEVVGQARAMRRGEEDPFEGFNRNQGITASRQMMIGETSIELDEEDSDDEVGKGFESILGDLSSLVLELRELKENGAKIGKVDEKLMDAMGNYVESEGKGEWAKVDAGMKLVAANEEAKRVKTEANSVLTEQTRSFRSRIWGKQSARLNKGNLGFPREIRTGPFSQEMIRDRYPPSPSTSSSEEDIDQSKDFKHEYLNFEDQQRLRKIRDCDCEECDQENRMWQEKLTSKRPTKAIPPVSSFVTQQT